MTLYDPTEDHYVALGVLPTATEVEIRAAHRAIILATHSDRTGDEGSRHASRANAARDVLMNAELRREYDTARHISKSVRLFPFPVAAGRLHRRHRRRRQFPSRGSDERRDSPIGSAGTSTLVNRRMPGPRSPEARFSVWISS